MQLPVNDSKLVFCSLGGNWPYKNFTSIIHALKYLKSSFPSIYEKTFYIQVGQANESLVSLAEKLGVSDACLFCGAVDDWRPVLASASFIFAPSFEEGLNLSVVEAAAYGIIPVLSKNKCLNEHSRMGDLFWFSDTNPRSIADMILHLHTLSPEDIKHLSDSISISCTQLYSSNVLVPKLLHVYSK